jgi:hypothetical protein
LGMEAHYICPSESIVMGDAFIIGLSPRLSASGRQPYSAA